MNGSDSPSSIDFQRVANSSGSQWVINENSVHDRSDVGNFLKSRGLELEEDGTLRIGGREITPERKIDTNVRYERSRRGDRIHIELMWGGER